jgi:hypothetical protein
MECYLKLIIAGSRDVTDYQILIDAISHFEIIGIREIVSGTANGADKLGERYAEENNIIIKRFPADWGNITRSGATVRINSSGIKYDAAAGYIRNKQMATYGDALLALHKNGSRGTKNMIQLAKEKGLPVWVYKVD